MKIIDLCQRRKNIFTFQLKQFFKKLDDTNFTEEADIDKRVQYFRRIQGEFLTIARLKTRSSMQDSANYMQMTAAQLSAVENGSLKIEDANFFKLAAYLGCTNEVVVFLEKAGKALRPGVRESKVLLLNL